MAVHQVIILPPINSALTMELLIQIVKITEQQIIPTDLLVPEEAAGMGKLQILFLFVTEAEALLKRTRKKIR